MSVHKLWTACRAAAAGMGILAALAAPPQLTTIEDVIYKADGSRFNGLVTLSWRSFEAADTANVASQVKTVRIVDGNLRVQLIPSTQAVPGFRYLARYNSSDGRIQYEEVWVVPPATVSLRVRDVRVLGGQGTVQPPAPLQQSDIVGLEEDLAERPVKGPGYGPGSVAWINAQGALEGIPGSGSDCVRVDGSSGPCGGGTAGPAYVDSETPAGPVDGMNATFTLGYAPDPPASLMLFRNGLLQKASLDYTLSAGTVTFLSAATPQNGDVLTASYRLSPAAGGPSFADAETPAGAMNGLNTVFTLTHVPGPAASLKIYRNGLLQRPGSDYSLSGQTLTFTPGSAPQAGDILAAFYRY
ncbi:MAG: hypothetical protein IT158_22380 [Bryobacterales bacterium]|nr:hypothetical protein [Bryobacterales bacterium]